MFKRVGEAYQILSDPNLRAVYDSKSAACVVSTWVGLRFFASVSENGKKQAGDQSGGMEDAGAMFSQLFGGESFRDWLGELALGK